MKRFLFLIFIIIGLSSCKSEKEVSPPPYGGVGGGSLPIMDRNKDWMEYSPTTLIIMVDESVGKKPLYKAIKDYGATLIYDYNIIPGVAIRIPEGTTLEQGIAYFKKVKGVVSVSKDRITRLTDPVRPRLEVK